ncbi:DUF2268 domain-containing protein [Halobacterium litoreum]|uniref:DUF2268 domain-containing protein n=1 Tax=Halobacterium litoreum TaxID=2039234 RepID=A0ABD5NB91_9EURY|nr:DUF2268 domain-containing protein [Halobacterium litoreum]UHH14752.1 DUF2268 domain-containing protein [Halobacterium litoreum]
MDRRRVLGVAVAVLFVTAGCQAPTNTATGDAATDAPTTERATEATTQTNTTGTNDGPAESTEFVTVTDDLPYDVAPIYRRTGRLLGLDQPSWPHTVVAVKEPPEGGSIGQASTSGFTNLVGIEPLPSAGEDGGVVTGAVTRGTDVTLFDHPNASAAFQQRILAHEFVHVFQTELPVRAAVDELDLRRNRAFLKGAMTEGSAEYVQERYGIEYQNVTLNQTAIPERWTNASAYVRYRIAPYEYGSRYFAMRLDDASGVVDVYENPPRTTEQLLHGYAPDGERAKELTVEANASESEFDVLGGGRTKGELFARLALSSELEFERAADAAAGWGMDRLVYFRDDSGNDAYAWVLRWDDASEATEFGDAFADYDAGNEEQFRLASVSDETVVVFAGADSFVENAAAAGNTSDVTVRA